MSSSIPDVVPNGAIFTTSGLDGVTVGGSRFVGTLFGRQSQPGQVCGLTLALGPGSRRAITVRLSAPLPCVLAVHDTFVAGSLTGTDDTDGLALCAVAWDALVLRLPAGAEVTFTDDIGTKEFLEEADRIVDETEHDTVAAWRRADRLVVCYGFTAETAEHQLGLFTDVDVAAIAAQRYQSASTDPAGASGSRYVQLANKCLAVMKVNTLSRGDGLPTAWSTPDRVPHRYLWLWDSVFHSFGMNHHDSRTSLETLRSLISLQEADGLIPLKYRPPTQQHPSGRSDADGRSQPPILAWGVWENHLITGDVDALRGLVDPLRRYLEWFWRYRRDALTGLFAWNQTNDPQCRSDESGMDNSPRFDTPLGAAVDLSCYLANDMLALGAIAETLGDLVEASHWRDRAAEIEHLVHSVLWDDEQQFYTDLAPDGTPTRIRAVSGFLPLLLPNMPQARADVLVRALQDPNDFGTAIPVPSVSRRDSSWSIDMWRGPSWINLNYIIIVGLRRQGRETAAHRLTELTLNTVERYYRETGVVFEFYDSAGLVPPPLCHRKGRPLDEYQPNLRIDCIRDYHWTAALCFALIKDSAHTARPDRGGHPTDATQPERAR